MYQNTNPRGSTTRKIQEKISRWLDTFQPFSYIDLKGSDFLKQCQDCVVRNFCKNSYKEKQVGKCSARFRLEKALKLSLIPPEYREANFSNSKNLLLTPGVAEVLNKIDSCSEEFFNTLILGAMCGVGKTYLASCFLNQQIYRTISNFNFEEPLALFIEYPALIHELRQFDRYQDSKVLELIEKIKRVPLLLLDDIAAGISSRFTREQTYIIINYRYNHKLSTIVTSNIAFNELASPELLGERIVSRLRASSSVINLFGKDRRVLGE